MTTSIDVFNKIYAERERKANYPFDKVANMTTCDESKQLLNYTTFNHTNGM